MLYLGNQQSFQYPEKRTPEKYKTAAKGSRIANHAWSNNLAIDFDNASIIDKGSFRTRKTLEAWHTKVTPDTDNNSCPLPGQYNILFSKCASLFTFLLFIISQFTLFSQIFLLFYIHSFLPVEDCSSGSRKLVVFIHFSQRSSLKFNWEKKGLN